MRDGSQKHKKRPEDRYSIRALHAINTVFARVYHRVTIIHPSNLPHDGPAIVVCNHISGLDPLLIQSACQYRMISWLMAKEYMELPVLGRVFKTLGVIPVDRGRRESRPLRQIFRQLEQGRIIGMFPEGKISTTGSLLEFQTGAALIAIRARVPVFPAYMNGTQRNKEMGPAFLHRSKSVLNFGPEVNFHRSDTSKETVQAATEAIKDAVALLGQEVDNSLNV